ncbi:MAG: hypothetical protein EOO99_01500 [Pedobacter sp.]|nr:MAG: hypothetical protein EOO99_01500 [Pedobacter sp.]
MKKKSKLLLAMGYFIAYFALIQCPWNLYAQYTGTVPRVTTVSPNSAALFKMDTRGEGSFSGTTPISIGLYTVQAGGIQVPISMNYANGGIRVEEIASWIGLGWNLNAGGRITRSMQSLPDDHPTYGRLFASTKPSAFPGSGSSTILANSTAAVAGTLDTEPDIFHFSFPGGSGKFFFDESGNVKLVSQQAIKITFTPSMANIRGWIVTDAQGTKYYFGYNKAQTISATEDVSLSYNSSGPAPGPTPTYYSSWHLMEIWDKNDENVIKFTYGSTSTSFTTLNGASISMGNMVGLDCAPGEGTLQEMEVVNSSLEYYLTKIEGAIDSLVFYSSGSRRDFQGGRKLDSIRLFSYNNQLVKRHHFNYGYFTQPGSPVGPIDDLYYTRLKLNHIAEFGLAANDSLATRFTYDEVTNLPSRLSRSVDYWGYFNGAFNTTLIPNGVYRNGSSVQVIASGADRRAYPNYARANTLTRITYPTGGYRQFTYEGNTALLDYYNSQINPDQSQYIYRSFVETNFNFTSPFIPAATKNFTIASDDTQAQFNWAVSGPCPGDAFEVKLFYLPAGLPENEIGNWTGIYNGSQTLNNGNYRIEVYLGAGCTLNQLDGNWMERNMPPTIYRYTGTYFAQNNNVGGIRVKEVADYDPASTQTYKTQFKYGLHSDSTLTSGLLISPVWVYSKGGCPLPYRDCDYLRLSASSSYPLSSQDGAYVFYPEVTIIEPNNGYTTRTYSFDYDIAPLSISVQDFPFIPGPDNSWKRGRVIMERNFTQSGVKVSEKFQEGNESGLYSADVMPFTQVGVKVVGYYSSATCPGGGHPTGIVCSACWRDYLVNSQFNALRVEKVRQFNPDNTYVELVKEYDYYTSLGRTLLKEERIYNSNGTVQKTSYRYAFNANGDFVFGLDAHDINMKTALLNKNYLEPLEITTYVGPVSGTMTLTKGEKFRFDTFNGGAHHLLVYSKYTSLSDRTQTVFSSYSTTGNLQEKYEQDDLYVGHYESYLWGYRGAYLVAQVKGATLASLSGLYNQSILTNPSSEAALRTHLNSLRTALVNNLPQVSTYTYKPLVGLLSETNPMGNVTFYEYDKFMRLENIKDRNNNILRNFKYHYKP